jgi:hypothetical protein
VFVVPSTIARSWRAQTFTFSYKGAFGVKAASRFDCWEPVPGWTVGPGATLSPISRCILNTIGSAGPRNALPFDQHLTDAGQLTNDFYMQPLREKGGAAGSHQLEREDSPGPTQVKRTFGL